MTASVTLLTALLTALAAAALAPWVQRLARSDSRWLRPGLAVVLAGLAGAGASALARGWVELAVYAVLGLACALLVVVDLATHRLPDPIVVGMYPVLLAGLGLAAALDGSWARFGRAAAAGAVIALGYLLLALAAPWGLGLGDVKLAGLLGAALGWLGWSNALTGTVAAFVLNGVVAALLLLGRRVHRRTELPFGPWMVAGAVLGAAAGPAGGLWLW